MTNLEHAFENALDTIIKSDKYKSYDEMFNKWYDENKNDNLLCIKSDPHELFELAYGVHLDNCSYCAMDASWKYNLIKDSLYKKSDNEEKLLDVDDVINIIRKILLED